MVMTALTRTETRYFSRRLAAWSNSSNSYDINSNITTTTTNNNIRINEINTLF